MLVLRWMGRWCAYLCVVVTLCSSFLLPSSLVHFPVACDEVHINLYKYAVSGAVAGGCRALSRGLTYPFDTIKTLQQVQSSSSTTSQGDPSVATESLTLNLTLQGYFRGVLPAVLSAVPANALFFVVYNGLDAYAPCLWPVPTSFSYSPDATSIFRLLQRVIVSSIATLPQNVVKIPFELLKQRAQTAQDKSLTELLADMSERGVAGLYQGGGAQLLREVPYNALQMSCYYYLREASSSPLASSQPLISQMHLEPTLYAALVGLVAAAIAALLTQPADVVKTCMMADKRLELGEKTTTSRLPAETSIAAAVRDIYLESGWKGFFVGLSSRLTLVSLGGMIYFASASIVDSLFDS